VNPDFGFPLSMEVLRKNGLSAYFPIRLLFETALLDPEIAKFIHSHKEPQRLPNGEIKSIANTPVYSANPFTTIHLSLQYAKNKNLDEAIFVGDCVKYLTEDRYGIVKRIYTVYGRDELFVDLQHVISLADPTLRLHCTMSKLPSSSSEYVLIPAYSIQVSLKVLKLQPYVSYDDESRVCRPKFATSNTTTTTATTTTANNNNVLYFPFLGDTLAGNILTKNTKLN
jgi:hypothetical protein